LEIGSEPTPEAFIKTMVAVFREVRRVLRPDGVVFINLGDSYADDSKWGGSTGGKHVEGLHGNTGVGRDKRASGLSGQLANIPHRVAEALRADGWIWRQTIVWAKKSPMPESISGWRWMRCRVKVASSAREHKGHERLQGARDDVDGKSFASTADNWNECPGCEKCTPNGGYVLRRGKGRCTGAHEYIFVMAKSDAYFWDSAASAEGCSTGTHPKGKNWHHKNGTRGERSNESFHNATASPVTTRNPRSVWSLSSEPTRVRHFATFPSELVRRCLISGPGTGGVCLACGDPYAPIIEQVREATRPALTNKDGDGTLANRDPERHVTSTRTLGYRPCCKCNAPKTKPICLDPFNGIATTGQTALALGYCYIGIDLNPDYIEVSKTRVFESPRWKLRQEKKPSTPRADKSQHRLFAEAAK
jgi:hypothetical protein